MERAAVLIAPRFLEHAHAPFSEHEPGVVDGPSTMRASMEWLTGQFPDVSMTIEDLVADGDVVAVRVLSTGPPTGRAFRAEQTHWFRLENGRTVEHWATRDDLAAMLQLGAVQQGAGSRLDQGRGWVEHGRMYAVRAAHAFDGRQFLPGGATVLVEGERIVGIEPFTHVLPAGSDVDEYSGTVLPGLIDCHTHLVADCTVGGLERAGAMTESELDAVILESLRQHGSAGVTTVRDLGDVAYRTLAVRRRPGLPRVVGSGPPVTSPGGHCHFLGGAVAGMGEDQLRTAVDERVERGVEVVKVMASGGFATADTDQLGAQFTTDQLAVMVDQAHRAGLPVVAHAHSLIAIERSLDARVDGIEHFTALSHRPGPRIEERLLEQAAGQCTYVDVTLGNDRSLHALITQPPPPLAALIARFGASTVEEFYQARIAQLSQLREHGVRVITGVDSGIAPTKKHGNLFRAVHDMLDAGYATTDALAAATSVAANACGLEGETGRLAPGHAADLLVVEGSLADGLDTLDTPIAVVIRGGRPDTA